MKKFTFLILVFLIMNLGFSFQETLIWFGNSNIDILPNEEISIPIRVENVRNLYGYSIYIEYEPDYVNIIEIREGELLKKDTPTLFLSKINVERKEIVVGGSRRGNIQGISGSGVLFYIKIILKERTKTYLKFKEVNLIDQNSNSLSFKSLDLTISLRVQDLPVLVVEPKILIFRNLDQVLEIRLTNSGKGILRGIIYTNDDWIVLNRKNFEGNNNSIFVAIKKQSNVDGTIFIESNGGNFSLKVRFEKVSNVRIILQIGNQVAYVNDISYLLPFPPYLEKGRTMVPLRFISEHRGAQVLWIKEESKVIILYETVYLELWVDQNKNYVRMNGVFYTIDVAPYTYKGRTVVPVRFISEFLGGKVNWNGDTKTVSILFES